MWAVIAAGLLVTSFLPAVICWKLLCCQGSCEASPRVSRLTALLSVHSLTIDLGTGFMIFVWIRWPMHRLTSQPLLSCDRVDLNRLGVSCRLCIGSAVLCRTIKMRHRLWVVQEAYNFSPVPRCIVCLWSQASNRVTSACPHTHYKVHLNMYTCSNEHKTVNIECATKYGYVYVMIVVSVFGFQKFSLDARERMEINHILLFFTSSLLQHTEKNRC